MLRGVACPREGRLSPPRFTGLTNSKKSPFGHLAVTLQEQTKSMENPFEKFQEKRNGGTDDVTAGYRRELLPGDAIEAFHNGTLVHRGPVTGSSPEHRLVGILDTLSGAECLLDLSEVEIVRLAPHFREVHVGEPRC